MTEITVKIPKGQLKFFTNLIKRLGYTYLSTEKDWCNDLTAEQKESIKRGKADIKAGRVTPHEEVKNEIRQMIEDKKTA